MKFLFVFIAVVLTSGCFDYGQHMRRAKDVKEKADTVKSIIEGIEGTIVEEEATTTE